MQTFLPFVDFADSSAVLDNRRLGKQRVETFQILRALTWPGYAWKNHPAVRMWRGFIPALVAYGIANCAEWVARGCADNVRTSLLAFSGGQEPDVAELARRGALPPWLGTDALHLSHQSALVRKEPDWYRPLFGDVPEDLPYWWPEDLFPRWPIRPTGKCTDMEALRHLGFAESRPGQLGPAAAVAEGRDCLAVFRPGTGGRSAGLIAGLRVGGRTLRVLGRQGASGRFERAGELPPRPAVPTRRPGPAELTARPPGPEDLSAMTAEVRPSPWIFVRPQRVETLERPSLIVIEAADTLDADGRKRIAAVRRDHGGPPVLALAHRADGATRERIAGDLDLDHPVHAGGGWDLDTFLDVVPAATSRHVRAALAASARPALVLVGDRTRVDRLVGRLTRAGVRAAGAARGMRGSRITEAGTSWRRRALDELVVTPDTDLGLLGRVLPTHTVTCDVPTDPADWRAFVDRSRAPVTTVLTAADAPQWAQCWARTGGCLRAWLLDRFGEPAEPRCGRCTREGEVPDLSRAAAPARVR